MERKTAISSGAGRRRKKKDDENNSLWEMLHGDNTERWRAAKQRRWNAVSSLRSEKKSRSNASNFLVMSNPRWSACLVVPLVPLTASKTDFMTEEAANTNNK